jgi:hypothetical protein
MARPHLKLPAAGFLIGLMLLAVSGLSGALASHKPLAPLPLALFLSLMTAAGGIYAAAAIRCDRLADSVPLRNWILCIALGLRLTMVTGTPILEDDHYRYLWDGALVAHGHNPYRHAPDDFLNGTPSEDLSSLAQLAEASGPILERINYPWLRTIYPPVAQAAFGAAHRLSPWSLWSWRLVLAVFELSALILLWRLPVPLAGLLIYGWNPLLIKEVYNSVHVDALMLPFLVAAVAATRREKPMVATAALGVATGVKLWPVLLMPMIWRRLTNRPLVLIASLSLSIACLAAALLPIVISGLDPYSGLAAYSRYWEMNDALFTLIAWGVNYTAGMLSLPAAWTAEAPRLVAAALVVGGIGWLSWRREIPVGQQFLMAVTLLFMLSPTQFPWYYIWLLPFLALHPHPALIGYTALLPLYYLRPLMAHLGYTDAFDVFIVWIQHGPVLIWLVWDWAVRRRWKRSGS